MRGALPSSRTRRPAIPTLLTAAALAFRLLLALQFPNDAPDDGRVYAAFARNILEHHVYSLDEEAPYEPSLIRVPGYPLFLAAIYAVCGLENNRAVRIVQAGIDTATCWLTAWLTLLWLPAAWEKSRRERAMPIALALAGACPFTAIYVATILTETVTMFLVMVCVLAGSLALKRAGGHQEAWWCIACGFAGGLASMFRPEAGLFAAGTGAALLMAGLWKNPETQRSDLRPAFRSCTLLFLGLAIALLPWTIRNALVFHVFQPLAPFSASTAEEFVPSGYNAWLRTWVDDEKYTELFEWPLDNAPVDPKNLPGQATDTPEEGARITELFREYNGGPQRQMTAQIDAAFAEVARERIRRHPLRYYLILPLKRVLFMWFDTHSRYYPFAGRLFPISGLNLRGGQPYWLATFAALVWMYTLLSFAGGWVMWRSVASRQFLLLFFWLIVPRLVLLSTLEGPEPRYVVELFPFAWVLGSIAVSCPRGVYGRIALTWLIRRRT